MFCLQTELFPPRLEERPDPEGSAEVCPKCAPLIGEAVAASLGGNRERSSGSAAVAGGRLRS